jgi:predicted kinase
MNIPNLILLVGLPGSGKSTWVETTQENGNYITICPDRIRKELYGNMTDQSHNIEVWAEAKTRTIAGLNAGKTVLIDATNVSTFYRKIFIQGLPDCKLQAVLFEVPPEDCWKRVKKDIDSGKDRAKVPEEVIYRMYEEFLYTKKVIESEGFEILNG